MTEEMALRLECLTLAIEAGADGDNAMHLADAFEEFVVGREPEDEEPEDITDGPFGWPSCVAGRG